MYVVTYNGKKLKVDDSKLSDDGYFPFQQTVGLYTDDTTLRPIWKLVGEHRDTFARVRPNEELEFIAEKVYDHQPSNEEILWFMSANGLIRGDIVTVENGFTLDIDGD